MPSSARALTVALLLPFAAAGPARAWTAATRTRMIDDALRLSPPALSRLLDRQRDECRSAAVDGPQGPESAHAWTAGEAREEAARAVEKAVRDMIHGITTHRPTAEVCRDAGLIGHLVADLNDPSRTATPAAGPLEPEAIEEFDRYAESVSNRVPLVFWGWRDDLASADAASRLAREIAERSGRDADGMRSAFYPEGRRVSASTFDDRSVPFAVASLAYSRTVSDTANLLYLVWKEAGGDLAGTPYRQAAPSPARAITNEDLH